MIFYKKFILHLFIPLLLSCIYGIDTTLVSLTHNHEAAIEYKDNCPACQWESQSQGDKTSIDSILDSLLDPLVLSFQNQSIETVFLVKQEIPTSNSSRAPPVSSL